MATRRDALKTIGGFAVTFGLAPAGAATGDDNNDYGAAIERTWRHTEGTLSDPDGIQRELVRYATLAPNSHNTQPWTFELQKHAILIRPDATRRCPIVDPDDHHVWISLGCAAENLVQAAAAFGRHGEVSIDHSAIKVSLAARIAPQRSALFEAIPRRQSTRLQYDGHALPAVDLCQLEQAAAFPGVRTLLMTERPRMEQVLDYLIQGNTAQMADKAFVAELKAWIRFSEAEAVAAGDGLFAGSSGNPSMPRWIASPLFSLFFTTNAENDKYAKHMRSSAGVAVFAADQEDREGWVAVGRSCQLFALQSAALDIRTAFVNQPVEVPAIRAQFAQWLGIGPIRPDLIIRFGRGPAAPPSLRRPVDSVIR